MPGEVYRVPGGLRAETRAELPTGTPAGERNRLNMPTSIHRTPDTSSAPKAAQIKTAQAEDTQSKATRSPDIRFELRELQHGETLKVSRAASAAEAGEAFRTRTVTLPLGHTLRLMRLSTPPGGASVTRVVRSFRQTVIREKQ